MCTCASCKHTDSFSTKGFAAWPKGDPAGARSSAAAYAAHVAHSRFGARARVDFGPAGAGFYGSHSTTRAEVERVLRASFVGVPVPYDPRDDAPEDAPQIVEKPPVLTLVQKARAFRAQAREERQQRRAA